MESLVINGYASAGLCILRLRGVGLKGTPNIFRIASENAAHRFLVRWRAGEKMTHGVYIPRRDTDSKLNAWLAGGLSSWPHYLVRFQVDEANDAYEVRMSGDAAFHVRAHLATSFPKDSMFDSLAHASAVFRHCTRGLSPSRKSNHFKVVRLDTFDWEVRPLRMSLLRSNFFSDESRFPKGSIEFDNALLMERVKHEWHNEEIGKLCAC